MLDEKSDRLIIDTYIPKDGTYIIVKKVDGHFRVDDIIEIRLDRKTNELQNEGDISFSRIRRWDYHSKLVSMNKPMDKNKVIHSNNYLSFFIKKENIATNKLTKVVIHNYYETLRNPYLKYTNSKQKEIYNTIEQELGQVDSCVVDEIEEWINENIFELDKLNIDLGRKEYLKIFFQLSDIEKTNYEYEREGKRYLSPNIYNSNDYNVLVKGEIFGLPDDNMGMNSKKPYLENKSRKVTVPYLLNKDEVLLQRKFFDYLLNMASIRKVNIYIDFTNDTIDAFSDGEYPDSDFMGGYIRIQKGKELEIVDFDASIFYTNMLEKDFTLKNYLQLDFNKIKNAPEEYERPSNEKKKLSKILNEILFSKYLKNNYFTKPSDIPIKDTKLKYNLLLGREGIYNWLYKGVDTGIANLLDRISFDLIKNSIINGNTLFASHQFNLRYSLREYFNKGEESMEEKMANVQDSLREKINQEQTGRIQTDEEYYFAVGQLVNYYISLNRSSKEKKVHALANPFFSIKSDVMLKEKLNAFFLRYNHAIKFTRRRFNHMHAMVAGYQPQDEPNQSMIIQGYLSSNLIYESAKEDDK